MLDFTEPQPSSGAVTDSPAANSITGLEHLQTAWDDSPGNPTASLTAQAVLYLRVSTPRQLHTAADLDEDGNSIATQRVEAMRKVRELRATVVREFIEPGQSAQTINKRAEFKKLLRYLDEHPEVKFVVIYMRSRVFRNFTDAAITKRQLLEKGVRLISAKEEFGEGYMADAMEAITDVMNEVQVRMNGEDVKVKMAHKVEQGGSVGRAKLGYLNVRKDFSGRLVNTIDVDPVRAPLVTWAFEQYATGSYSISQLQEMLQEQGLTMRPSPARAEKPVSHTRLAGILRDPYYTGVIRYKGRLYAGRHEPLISKETFLKVQAVLDQRTQRGDKDVVHFHYFKGIIYCGRCAEKGRKSRLLYSQASGNGGVYEYFVCTSKQRRLCDMPWLRIEIVEKAVERAIMAEGMDTGELERLKVLVTEAVDDILAADKEAKAHLRKQLKKLEAQEERLINLAATGTAAIEKIHEQLEKTSLQKAAVAEKLETTAERLKYGAEMALAYLDLLREPGKIYENAPDSVRRDMLTALYSEILINAEEGAVEAEPMQSEANTLIRSMQASESPEMSQNAKKKKAPRANTRGDLTETSLSGSLVRGSTNSYVAGIPGLEPRMTVPETVVLPITPYPNGKPLLVNEQQHQEITLAKAQANPKLVQPRHATRERRVPSLSDPLRS